MLFIILAHLPLAAGLLTTFQTVAMLRLYCGLPILLFSNPYHDFVLSAGVYIEKMDKSANHFKDYLKLCKGDKGAQEESEKLLKWKQPCVYSTRKEAITLAAEQMAKDPILSKVSDMQRVASCMHANVRGTCASLDVDSFPLSHIAAYGPISILQGSP